MGKYYIGIDLGGTNIAAGVVSEQGELLSTHVIPTMRERTYKEIAKDMYLAAFFAAEKVKLTLNDFDYIGVGTPGWENPKTGNIVYSNSLCWINVPLHRELEKLFNKKILIRNDGDCALLGEVVSGAAKNHKNVIMLTLGTGVGGGILLNGKLYSGADRMGGELGHMSINPNGNLCSCGKRGCL